MQEPPPEGGGVPVPTQTKLLINGELVDAVGGKTFPVIDPRTELPICEVAEATAADVDIAVAAARRAFDLGPWPKMSGRERGRILFRFADLLEAHAEELAALETLDNGKPLFFSRNADIPLSIDHFRYFAGWADKIHGKTIPVDGDLFAYTLHEPIGVVGQITPWNFPLLMAAWKVAPALACGNTVVLKVAEQTPLTALRMGELAIEAGIPPGVLNVLSGFGETAGAALSEHMDVDKVAFTGSTEVGRTVMEAAARSNLKKVSLELGGKSPVIVCEGVDVDFAVEQASYALFFNHGQCCAAGSRCYVHDSVYDEFVAKVAAKAKERRVGDPFGDVDQGPQVDADQMKKVMRYIQLGKEQGATLLAGGGRHGDEGYYVEPTVFGDVQEHHDIWNDEIFGPVMSIAKFSDLDDVIARANRNAYGLAAGVISNDLNQVNTLTRGLRAGTVWVNTHNVYDAAMPFGGYKQSGIGRDKGEYALENYLEVKTVAMPMEGAAWK
mmetsp:Transcript_28494/g.91305  ORF Transcript_28494/g.91305 Transcript_28494/m.91305 type:complete len:497 (+) Transcript_28494:329-1819(+)